MTDGTDLPGTDDNDLPGKRPELSITQAAEAAGVNPRTIRRYLTDEKLPGARKAEDGSWLIPTEALIAAGWTNLYKPSPPDAPVAAPEVVDANELADLRAELIEEQRAREQAEHRAELAQARADMAEAVAVERERIIKTQELALRALMPGPQDSGGVAQPPATGTSAQPTTQTPTAGQSEAPRRRWWSRRERS